MPHRRGRPQHQVVVLPTEVDEVDPVLPLIVVPDRYGGDNARYTPIPFEG